MYMTNDTGGYLRRPLVHGLRLRGTRPDRLRRRADEKAKTVSKMGAPGV